MLRSVLLAGALALTAAPLGAQTLGSVSQDAPARVRDVVALGRGGTRAAAPTLDSPFFSNPAHLTAESGFKLTILGATTGVGGNVIETYDFYDDVLGPALEEGLDTIRDEDPDRLDALYAEARRVGAGHKTANVAAFAPSARYNGGAFAVGGGLFGNVTTRALLSSRSGGGVPFIDAYGQADVMVPLAVAAPVPAEMLEALPVGSVSVGASATFLRRYVTAKDKPIDAIDPDGEKLYLLSGNTLRGGLGVYARDVGVPGLDLGTSLMNVGGNVNYSLDQSWTLEGPDDLPDDQSEIDATIATFEERAARPEFRVGAAYRVQLPAMPDPYVSDIVVAADYTSLSTSNAEQSVQAGLRGGVSATLASVLGVRAGVSQGMATGGASLMSRYARLDFVTYGVEDARLLGGAPRRAYALQVRFGLF